MTYFVDSETKNLIEKSHCLYTNIVSVKMMRLFIYESVLLSRIKSVLSVCTD